MYVFKPLILPIAAMIRLKKLLSISIAQLLVLAITMDVEHNSRTWLCLQCINKAFMPTSFHRMVKPHEQYFFTTSIFGPHWIRICHLTSPIVKIRRSYDRFHLHTHNILIDDYESADQARTSINQLWKENCGVLTTSVRVCWLAVNGNELDAFRYIDNIWF